MEEWLACCGSAKFAQQMAAVAPFSNPQEAIDAAKDIWFNKVDVNGWLEAFAAHPAIGESPSNTVKSPTTTAEWSNGEQSTALATATDATIQELYYWNSQYRQKFGFVFLICASGRSTPEILTEIKKRYLNRPIIEFELAAKEQMKITELRISKLFTANATSASTTRTPRCGDNSQRLHECDWRPFDHCKGAS
ncbi:uric acid degradation bifunctional protein TTL-like [Salvia splendens]|uniref:uric acid degradation bifunctional protein TTL-like n=1 Tax=Salvia splendens TaxID=180675 RepID=UPI001C25C378|nr:uric acid degradation bifunctional protein TTL-like [Salvia splendens]